MAFGAIEFIILWCVGGLGMGLILQMTKLKWNFGRTLVLLLSWVIVSCLTFLYFSSMGDGDPGSIGAMEGLAMGAVIGLLTLVLVRGAQKKTYEE
jgi:H+/Cl- antiporter ClcA